MVFQFVASSFPLLALLFCALFYADYALTILGQRLYLAKAREVQEFEAYELNPLWRETVEKSRYWSWRLWRGFLPMVLMAGCLWCLGWLAGLMVGQGERPGRDWFAVGALWYRDAFCAAVISRSLVVIGMHLRNIALFARYLAPEYVSGKLTLTSRYSYAVSRIHALTLAVPLAALAILEPTPVTVGFALGPLVLAANLRRMEARNARQAAAGAAPVPAEETGAEQP
jgi:hypothetical protein